MLAEKLKQMIYNGPERSVKARKNILAMLFLRGGNILISFLLVPLTINYVDSDTYGIWLTISSMVAWMSFLDIGINNGLKNKLTESLAQNDIEKAQRYVSTTYALLCIIFIPLMFVLLSITPLVDWNSLLNLNNTSITGLATAMSIVIAYFCINFILSTVNIVLLAYQRPAAESLRNFLQQLLTLCVIFILTKTIKGNLNILCLALCLCPLVTIFFFNISLFSKRYYTVRPIISKVDFKLAPDLFKLGIQFFIIQIAAIVQYQMTNFLIIRHFGANDVTSYNIAYKYFNVLYMLWCIIILPVWAAVTDALAKNDLKWIKNTVIKYFKLFVVFVAASGIMLIVSKTVYHIWIGDTVHIPFDVSLFVMLFNLVMIFGSIFVNVLNGMGELKIQAVASIISPFVFLGVFYLLKDNNVGVISIIIASIVANFNGLILAPVQYFSILKKKKCR